MVFLALLASFAMLLPLAPLSPRRLRCARGPRWDGGAEPCISATGSRDISALIASQAAGFHHRWLRSAAARSLTAAKVVAGGWKNTIGPRFAMIPFLHDFPYPHPFLKLDRAPTIPGLYSGPLLTGTGLQLGCTPIVSVVEHRSGSRLNAHEPTESNLVVRRGRTSSLAGSPSRLAEALRRARRVSKEALCRTPL